MNENILYVVYGLLALLGGGCSSVMVVASGIAIYFGKMKKQPTVPLAVATEPKPEPLPSDLGQVVDKLEKVTRYAASIEAKVESQEKRMHHLWTNQQGIGAMLNDLNSSLIATQEAYRQLKNPVVQPTIGQQTIAPPAGQQTSTIQDAVQQYEKNMDSLLLQKTATAEQPGEAKPAQ